IKKLIPRLELIQPDEAGVRITLGTREKVLGPGWYLLWPIIQEIFYTTVTPQVVDIRSQSVISKEGINMTVSGAIKYRVSDIRKAMLEIQDYDRSLETLSLGVLLEVVSTLPEEELHDVGHLGDLVLKKIREEASGWGLRLQKVYITDLGQVKNIRLLTNGAGVLSG
ncbi:hypothetical protein LCGC14_2484290, partial [marine sediment metagenome]